MSPVANQAVHPTSFATFKELEKLKKFAYVALKVTSVLMIAGGIGLTGGAAWFVWPKVTHLIVQAAKGLGPSGLNVVAMAIVKLIEGFIHVLGACLKMGGDIGGFCALFVVLLGIGVVGLPVFLTYGLPVVPGIALTAGGFVLWCQTDKLVKVPRKILV